MHITPAEITTGKPSQNHHTSVALCTAATAAEGTRHRPPLPRFPRFARRPLTGLTAEQRTVLRDLLRRMLGMEAWRVDPDRAPGLRLSPE
ncbi:hypothetical protein [Streptomyces xinghaiensis]|uniref:hypothetical protein n=1 Tax=Streptomyces xinghaiensis TaxID=1038928 RepID=UPI000303D650|nr:hypothetical protein [Streptomyces xinghaiensis]MZE77075.1 hypothetical protein [Streptomyces sp. SID5475]